MAISSAVKEAIRKYAIKNAVEYGKAREDNVLGKVISQFPEVKSDMAAFRKEIKSIVDEVNKLGKPDLEKKAKPYENDFDSEYKEKEEKTSKPNFAIDGAVEGKFKTRFPPAPT